LFLSTSFGLGSETESVESKVNEDLEFEVPSWEQIYKMLLNLADKIRRDKFKPDIIVGVSRGGWIPARVMSDLLESHQTANVKAEFYKGIAETKNEPIISQSVSMSVSEKRLLVVDDVADTGRSLQKVQKHLLKEGAAEARVATIYYKPWSDTLPDYYEKETKLWLVFPWERKETVRHILEKYETEEKNVEEAEEKLVKSGFNRKFLERFIREIREGMKSR
jgi:hypoxanthine phosphoribosyltransferase